MRTIAVIAVAIAVAASSGSVCSAGGPVDHQLSYYPMALGNEWVYSVRIFDSLVWYDTVRIDAKTVWSGHTYYHLVSRWFPVYSVWTRVDSLGDMYWSGGEGQPDHPLLLFSHPPGTGWLLGERHCVDSAFRSPYAPPVQTSLGYFDRVVRLRSYTREFDCTDADWGASFADGIGPVQWLMYGAGVVHEYTLVGVTLQAACDCGCHGDPYCNGDFDIIDIVAAIDVAFRGRAPITDHLCPPHANAVHGRTDLDCDGMTDIFDVLYLVYYVFRSGDPVSELCDPCDP